MKNDKEKIIAIDLGGTLLRVALIENKKIKTLIKKNTPKNKEQLKKELQKSVSQILKKEKNVRGIGISSAGPLKKGVITNPPNLDFKNFDLRKSLKKFNLEIIIENDANCAALAEAKLGIKKKNFILLTLGTGIGGGIIIDNKVYPGRENAGEVGHIILDNGKTFEELIGGKRIKEITKKIYGKELLVKHLIKRKDKKSKEILKEIEKYLGQGIGSLINIFDPERIILTGGFREGGKKLLKGIKEETKNNIKIPHKADLKWSKLKEPGILGASLLFEKNIDKN